MRAYPGQSTLLVVFILLVTILFVPAWIYLGPVGAPPTIKIGLVAPFEGLHRPLGYEALFAVKLALQERNQSGGVNNYRVELVALNDFDEPAEARVQARALLADPDVLGVVGHLSSETTLAAMPIYREAGLAVSVPWTTVTVASGGSRDGVVSVAASYSDTSARLNTVAEAMGLHRLEKLADNNVKSVRPNTQALWLDTDGLAAGEIILALNRLNSSLPLLGQVDVGSPQVVQMAGAAANGLIYVSPGPDPTGVAGAESFVEAYRTLAGFTPGPRAVLAYDATQVLLDAINQAMLRNNYQPTRSEVSAIINNIQRRGISGDIAFDTRGQRINSPVWVYQITEEEYPGTPIVP